MQILKQIKSLPPNEQLLAAQKLMQELCKSSLAITCRKLLGYRDINKRTHGEVIECLQHPCEQKLIVMPRGSLKSSIGVVAYPIWLLLKNPNLRILIDSELYTNSKNFLREIKGHFESNSMTNLFGDFKTDHCWREDEIIIKQRTVVKKEASITASGIGSEKTGQHYDVVIMDDLNSPKNSNTEEGRQKVIAHFRYMVSILDPGGIKVVIGTRYAEDDIEGWVLHNLVNEENEI